MKKTKLPKPTTIKLALTKETVRVLPETDLRDAVGGVPGRSQKLSFCVCHTC